MLPENKRLGIGLILDEIDALKDKVKRLEEER
jgi:hypothetical protein